MALLDEQGRLFGRINVVDAVVVVFALAVIVAGVALYLPTDQADEDLQGEETTRYVTVVSTSGGATAFETGPVLFDDQQVNITDVHRTAGPRVYFRVELEGVEQDGQFRFGDRLVRLDDRYSILSNTSRAKVVVRERDATETFETDTTTVVLETEVRPQVAEAVSSGDEYRIGGTPIATVTAVESEPAEDQEGDGRRLSVTLELETRTVGGVPHYAGNPVRLGRTLGFATDEYQFVGEVVERR